MKRALLVFLSGLLLGAVAYAGLYFSRTSKVREMIREDNPELVWLKQEFGLNQQEFEKVRALHEGYLPNCAKMCARIAAANSELEELVMATNQVTPEISLKLAEIGRLRQECQEQMLNHFYEVSRSMPSEQGRRYLEQMHRMTSLANMRQHPEQKKEEPAHGH